MSLSGIKESNLTLLLKALKEETGKKKETFNNGTDRDVSDTWRRIGKREQFDSLGFGSDDEMKEWILNNPYVNL